MKDNSDKSPFKRFMIDYGINLILFGPFIAVGVLVIIGVKL